MADLLIRGVAMPKDQHTITITICHDGYTVVEYRDNGLLLKEIETYKTIPLPEGHGDLIDKQAFKADIDGFIEDMTKVGAVVDGEMLWGKLLDALENAATIVPAEGGTDE